MQGISGPNALTSTRWTGGVASSTSSPGDASDGGRDQSDLAADAVVPDPGRKYCQPVSVRLRLPREPTPVNLAKGSLLVRAMHSPAIAASGSIPVLDALAAILLYSQQCDDMV